MLTKTEFFQIRKTQHITNETIFFAKCSSSSSFGKYLLRDICGTHNSLSCYKHTIMSFINWQYLLSVGKMHQNLLIWKLRYAYCFRVTSSITGYSESSKISFMLSKSMISMLSSGLDMSVWLIVIYYYLCWA